MSQVTSYVTSGSPLTMAALAAELNAEFAAAISQNRGATAPSNPVEGMFWLDTSGGATAEVLKRYTVAGGWVAIMSFNITAGTYSIPSPTLVTPAMAIGADADGDTYYRASNVLARLAKGTANYKMFMNAAGTAPEWAAGLYTGTIVRDLTAASGDVSYTGVGFKGSLLTISGSKSGSVTGTINGISDGTKQYCTYHWSDGGIYVNATYCFIAADVGGSQTAVLKSFDADGFTLTWTKASSPTGNGTIYYTVRR